MHIIEHFCNNLFNQFIANPNKCQDFFSSAFSYLYFLGSVSFTRLKLYHFVHIFMGYIW